MKEIPIPEEKSAGLSWIELKRDCEMPDIDEPVLWLQEDGIFFVREIDKDDHSWWKGDENTDAPFGSAPKCTHWARIPLPDESPASTPSVGGIKWVEASERLPDKPANLQRLFVDWKGSFNIWVYFAEQGFWVWFTTFRRVSDSEMTEVLWLDIFGIPIGENEAERIHAKAIEMRNAYNAYIHTLTEELFVLRGGGRDRGIDHFKEQQNAWNDLSNALKPFLQKYSPSLSPLKEVEEENQASAILQHRLEKLYHGFNITMLGEHAQRLRAFIKGLADDLREFDRIKTSAKVEKDEEKKEEGNNSQYTADKKENQFAVKAHEIAAKHLAEWMTDFWSAIWESKCSDLTRELCCANARIADLEKLLEEKQECINNQKYIEDNMAVLKKEAKK